MENKNLPEGIEFNLIKRTGKVFLFIPFNREIIDDDVLKVAEYITNCLGYTFPVCYYPNENLDNIAVAISPYKGFAPDPVSGMMRNISISKPHFTFTKSENNKRITITREINEDYVTFNMLMNYFKPN